MRISKKIENYVALWRHFAELFVVAEMKTELFKPEEVAGKKKRNMFWRFEPVGREFWYKVVAPNLPKEAVVSFLDDLAIVTLPVTHNQAWEFHMETHTLLQFIWDKWHEPREED